MRGDVLDFEVEIDKLEQQKTSKHIIPGDRIHKMMTNWNKESLYGNDDIASWKLDFWLTLE